MSPHDRLINSDKPVWCLAEPEGDYLVYALEGGPFELNLSAARGEFTAKWFDPRTGKLSGAGDGLVQGGKSVRFTAPNQQDWGLWLSKTQETGHSTQ
jgi:hypothetical protein